MVAKIKEIYTSEIKDNGKFDVTFTTIDGKEYKLINCECVAKDCYDDFDDEHELNMTFTYAYQK